MLLSGNTLILTILSTINQRKGHFKFYIKNCHYFHPRSQPPKKLSVSPTVSPSLWILNKNLRLVFLFSITSSMAWQHHECQYCFTSLELNELNWTTSILTQHLSFLECLFIVVIVISSVHLFSRIRKERKQTAFVNSSSKANLYSNMICRSLIREEKKSLTIVTI